MAEPAGASAPKKNVTRRNIPTAMPIAPPGTRRNLPTALRFNMPSVVENGPNTVFSLYNNKGRLIKRSKTLRNRNYNGPKPAPMPAVVEPGPVAIVGGGGAMPAVVEMGPEIIPVEVILASLKALTPAEAEEIFTIVNSKVRDYREKKAQDEAKTSFLRELNMDEILKGRTLSPDKFITPLMKSFSFVEHTTPPGRPGNVYPKASGGLMSIGYGGHKYIYISKSLLDRHWPVSGYDVGTILDVMRKGFSAFAPRDVYYEFNNGINALEQYGGIPSSSGPYPKFKWLGPAGALASGQLTYGNTIITSKNENQGEKFIDIIKQEQKLYFDFYSKWVNIFNDLISKA